jgi:hypothetical protein
MKAATIMISNDPADLVGVACELPTASRLSLVCDKGCVCGDCLAHMKTCIINYGEGILDGKVDIEGFDYGSAVALYILDPSDLGEYVCDCCGMDCASP